LGSELEAEISTAERIDALVSFVTWEGWRRMSDAFQRFALNQRPLRLMTTASLSRSTRLRSRTADATLLLLRPTSSPTVFLQQLGRGLRLHLGKSSCLVLDFIGQAHEQFRFDRTLTALTGLQRGQLRSAVEQGFPSLPSGCHLKLDKVSRQTILQNLKTALGGGTQRLARELRACADAHGGSVTLAQFLDDTGRRIEDVYATGYFTALRRLACVPALSPAPEEEMLGSRLGLLTHLDDRRG